MRTGDTPARERQALLRRPPDLLITTPESLYLMLTSSAAETLAGVETVIVDEIHALAATKRGAHLAVSLERLEEVTARPPQRIGLSATQRPLEEVARFLGGWAAPGDAARRRHRRRRHQQAAGDRGRHPGRGHGRPRRPRRRRHSAERVYGAPAAVSTAPRGPSIWPSIYPRILDQILAHRSTIIFCNARRQAERLAAKLNELSPSSAASASTPTTGEPRGELVKAHHGSLAREQRVIVEDELKRGDLRAIVATSSLELGIDMGAVDLVIQVESPGACQPRPAAHRPGRPPGRRAEPRHDLPEAPRRPARGGRRRPADARRRDRVHPLPAQPARRARPADRRPRRGPRRDRRRRRRGDGAAHGHFAELSDELLAQHARPARRPLPDRGVLRAAAAARVGPGQRHGARPRRLEAARRHVRRHDPRSRPVRRVPARRQAGRRARRGDGLREPARRDVRARRVDVAHRGHHVRAGHRHAGAGRAGEDAVLARRPSGPAARARPGARRLRARAARVVAGGGAAQRCATTTPSTSWRRRNLLQYLDEQAEATGVVPDDRTIVVERFRDEIGDWRVCMLSPFGTPVHAPWAMAIERRLADRYDLPVESMWGDDGIVLRLPEAADELPLEAISIDPEDIEELVVVDAAADGAVLVALPRVRRARAAAAAPPARPAHAAVAAAPDGRRPARRRGQVPDVPDPARGVAGVPAGRVRRAGAARGARPAAQSRAVRVVTVDTTKPSPMAQSLLFNWIAAYMYEGDAPLAERRAAALALDRDLLADLLGAEELRELLDPGVLADVELDLQHLSDGRRARTADELHDVLRRVGDLTRRRGRAALRARRGDRQSAAGPWLADAASPRRRAIEVVVAGEAAVRRRRGRRPLPRRARLRAAARAARGVHRSGAAPARGPRRPLRPHPRTVRRARGRRPLRPARVAGRRGAGGARGRRAGRARRVPPRRRAARVVRRRGAAPAAPPLAGRAAPRGRAGRAGGAGRVPAGVARRQRHQRRGVEALVEALGVLAGAPIVASTLEPDVLAGAGRRLPPVDARRAVHVGRRGVGRRRGDRLERRSRPAVLRRPARPAGAGLGAPAIRPSGALHDAVRELLAGGGASFWAPAAGRRRRSDRRRAARRAVGPRVGRRGHQRLARPRCGR